MTTTTTARRSPIGDQLAALTVRNLRTSARVPQLLMFSLTMPMAMLVLFSQVFRSVATGPGFPTGISYIDFLTPAMLAVSTVMAGTNAGVSAAIDHTNGLHDRFAALPMRAPLPGLARTINEALFTLARAALLGIAALALGFRFHGTAIDALAAVVVLVVLAGAMSALFGLIGDRLRRPDVVQFAGMMAMMPLMFISSAFAPIQTMPGWMQALATINPVAHATDALRGHVLGTATLTDTATALIAALGLWVVVAAVPALTSMIRSARAR
ncbi:ABC transporter permease [Nocardia bovistercoris]|uniref:Transport permease protein n=1 Tax=Nocardia bovistercoris TaxID=2785916 RepID=A0A931MZ15_9NOCA|nr:ABC transporter permease [Nocardia bovistercoris]MBH0775655.1 ABC transporter permease [Nocardia bovistercoris]